MKLSLSIITRNEESTLPLALQSVAGVVDEIVVIDTGSTDRTKSVAAEFGATVFNFPWTNDFSAARNHALPHLTGDWVLVLDADEEFLPDSRDELRHCLTREDALGFTLLRQNLTRADDPAHFTESPVLRLMRRIPGVRFTGRIHERITPSLPELLKTTGQKILPSTIRLRHRGYAAEFRDAKLRRSLPLLKLELDDHPDALHPLIEYGRTLLQLHDPAGHQVLARASQQLASQRGAPQPPEPIVATLLEYLLTTPPHLIGGPLTPADAATLAARWFPDAPPLLFAAAQSQFKQGRFQDAARAFARLVYLGLNGRYDRSVPFDPRLVGPHASLNLANCHIRLGNYDAAERLLLPLLTDPACRDAAAKNLAFIQQLPRPK